MHVLHCMRLTNRPIPGKVTDRHCMTVLYTRDRLIGAVQESQLARTIRAVFSKYPTSCEGRQLLESYNCPQIENITTKLSHV